MAGDTGNTTSNAVEAAQAVEGEVASMFAALRSEAPETDTPPAEEAETVAPEEVVAEEQEPDTTDEAPVEVPSKLKVKLDDEEVDEDTLREWKKGYSRQSDYTRKTQAHSEEVKAFQAERLTFNETKAAQLKQLEEAIQAVTPQEPDWAKARAEMTADQYLALRADWDAHHQQMQKLQAERAKVDSEVQAERSRKAAEQAERNVARVMELLPDWKDEGKRQAQFGDIKKHVLEPLGIPETEVLGAGRPELFRILHEAAEYRKLQATKNLPAVKQAVASKPLTPGHTPSDKPKASAAQTAARKLAQTGRDEDFQAFLKAYRTGT